MVKIERQFEMKMELDCCVANASFVRPRCKRGREGSIYFIEVQSDNQLLRKKFVKE
jgi:hypothetical protein